MPLQHPFLVPRYVAAAKLGSILFYTTLYYLSIFNAILLYNIGTILGGFVVMKALKEKISITIDSDLLEKARAEAEKDDRSLSQFINVALKEYLKNK